MKVLILGYKGMLGQALTEEFKNHGYETVLWDKEDIDVGNLEMLSDKIKGLKPDVLINATAINAVDKIEEDSTIFELARKINSEAVGEMAKICKEQNIVFVHYSSDYVFYGDKKEGYDENSELNPVDKYGETKAVGEKLLKEQGEKYYLIRLSKLFGKPAIAEGAKKSFVDMMIWLATEGGKTHLDLVDEEISCPTYAPDLAIFTRKLLEENKSYGIYHGANTGVCSWYELALETFKIKNIQIDTTPVSGDKFPRPAKRPVYSELLNTKMSPQRSWQEALREYLK
ncbi:MAG TPA: dTDP-4-dehydrorhamnose reductase [Candidatus Magasanikbacteria bacterium]|nr:dTDP-4-dehydrorhamnose reductase [Candidatus Magasanikbacteria bacterium]